MNTTEIPLDERIRTFADSVREHLDDLPGDEVDDIIVGLVADLAEQAADGGGVLELGDPVAYASELRSAAGLPERADAVKREPLRVRLTARARARAFSQSIRRSTFGAWLLDLLVALRPVWWVLRGLAFYYLVHALLGSPSFGGSFAPDTFFGWVVGLALILISVQWGRGRWLPKNPLRHVREIASAIALVALPFTIASAVVPRVEYVDSGGYEEPGLLLDGVQVGNVFAYDENGELIESVQLYTDRGTPLNLLGGMIEDPGEQGWYGFDWNGDDVVRVPFRDAREAEVWNIYPLREGKIDPNTGKLRSSTIKDAAAPFVRAPGLVSPSPAPTEAQIDEGSAPTPSP